MNQPGPDEQARFLKIRELEQQLKTIYRKRADDTGLNFRRFVTGINVGGIIVTLYACKILIELEKPVDPFNTWLPLPFFIFLAGVISTGISNYVAKYKRDNDAKRIETTTQNPLDWSTKNIFYSNTFYEVMSTLIFVIATILEVLILKCILSNIII